MKKPRPELHIFPGLLESWYDPTSLSAKEAKMQISSIRIVTKDVAALAAFYAELTGAPVNAHPDFKEDFAELRMPGCSLAICSHRSVERFNAGAATPGANQSAILEFEVADIDAERSRLGGLVRNWVQEPTKQPWGNQSMLFRDPDGNLYPVHARTRKSESDKAALMLEFGASVFRVLAWTEYN